MKTIFTIIGIFISFTLLAQNLDIRQNLMQCQNIQDGMEKYLAKIPLGMEEYFGFESRLEFESAILGRPFQIYYLQYDSITLLPNGIIRSEVWYAPITSNNRYNCFLRIQKSGAEYKVVGIGYNEIARDVQNFMKQKSISESDNYGLVIDEAFNVLYQVTKEDRFTPIRSSTGYTYFDSESGNDLSKEEFISIIIKHVIKTRNQ